MKCLLCSSKFDDEKGLLEHYISFHKIDESNWFFKNLFGFKNSKILRKCLRCDDFIYDKKAKVEHDFLNHFSEGKEQLFENKPLDVTRLRDQITIYSIDFIKHRDSYNFFDSEKCVTDFLRNYKDKLTNNNRNKTFKCSFIIQNQQILPTSNGPPSFDNRYWSTSPYEGVYFNDFIYFGIKGEILNRVIINGLSGSSWFFKWPNSSISRLNILEVISLKMMKTCRI